MSSSKSALLLGLFGVAGTLWSLTTASLLLAVVYLALGGWRTLRLLVATAPRDIRAALGYLRLNWYMRRRLAQDATVGRVFDDLARRQPDKACLVDPSRVWTFSQVHDLSERVAAVFWAQGLRPGDEVVILTESRPEAVILWLGLSKVGVVSALVNSNLKQAPLAHCISCVRCRAVVFSAGLLPSLRQAVPLMGQLSPRYFCLDAAPEDLGVPCVPLAPLLAQAEPRAPPYRGSMNDRLLYIYTSGTTGLPKAAIIRQRRFFSIASSVRHMMPLRDDDVLYVCLPIYHVAAGVLAVSQTLLFGNTAVLRAKFSASAFWDDCIRWKCTVSQYIGETCRYLLAQPTKDCDRQHGVRLMFGNGLRPQLWKSFAERFGVRDLREVYGATEGNANLVNTDNRVGAVGFVPTVFRLWPVLAEWVLPVKLVRVDRVTGLPLRDKRGLCVACQPGEEGELVGKVDRSHMRSFDGYVSHEATQKKLYRDVFRKGDAAFASGDLLLMDDQGYVYFRDRTGDTFRWKGENVSTAEVEAVASQVLGLTDCVVYGVALPGTEGRAGMLAVCDPSGSTDLDALASHMCNTLPPYAVPLLVRFTSSLQLTATFKLQKGPLQRQGFEQLGGDPCFLLQNGRYVPLEGPLYDRLCAGQCRL
ncbi:unnamed protein product [Ixodes hexagonus]